MVLPDHGTAWSWHCLILIIVHKQFIGPIGPHPSSPSIPRAPFEVLLRRALLLPSRPAIVILNGFRWSGVKEEDKGEAKGRGFSRLWD